MQYELCFLVGEKEEPNLATITNEVKAIVTNEGGVFSGEEVTQKRKLSYEVKHQYRGIYVANRFDVPEKDADDYKETMLADITRKLNLYPNILRFIIVKADELPPLKQKEAVKAPAQAVEKPRPAAPAPKAEKAVEEPKETPASDNAIDKKLEEILNI